MKPEDIADDFETFHQALKSIYGPKHYSIERTIIITLHERTKKGVYQTNDEIIAFGRMINVFMRETEANIESRKQLYNITSYAKTLEERVKEAQIKLKDTERLAIIGQTASMVGHDIRNPLQAITGDLYIIKDEFKGMPESENKNTVLESLDAIEENIGYINKIVSDLQDYTRALKPTIKPINLKDLICSTLLTINIPKRIKTTVKTRGDLTINTDAAFLRRALTNLITNAVQAMPNQGNLTITAANNDKKQL